jgi:hypothetical protein
MNKILTERGTKKCKVILTHSEDIFIGKDKAARFRRWLDR